jgi:UrcA family protein
MFAENRDRAGTGITGFTASLAVGFISLLPLAASAAQGARPQFEGPAVVVNYADLDINTPRGAEKLYARIEQAAVRLCPQVDFGELQRYVVFLRCRDTVVAQAVSSINSPQLAAVYVSRTHHAVHSPV